MTVHTLESVCTNNTRQAVFVTRPSVAADLLACPDRQCPVASRLSCHRQSRLARPLNQVDSFARHPSCVNAAHTANFLDRLPLNAFAELKVNGSFFPAIRTASNQLKILRRFNVARRHCLWFVVLKNAHIPPNGKLWRGGRRRLSNTRPSARPSSVCGIAFQFGG